MSSFFFDSRNPQGNNKKRPDFRKGEFTPGDPNITFERRTATPAEAASYMLSPNANVFSTAAFDQLLSSGWDKALGGMGTSPQNAAATPVAKSTTPPAAPSTPYGERMDQGGQPQAQPAVAQPTTQPGAQPPAQPGAQPVAKPAAAPVQTKGPADTAAEIQETDDVPGLIGMMHEIRSGANGVQYPPEVVRSLTSLIQQRIQRIQDREKQEGKEEQRKRWADQRTRDDLKREYPMWAAWKRSNPDIDVGDDLSFEAFEKEMANPERARAFRGHRRLSSMKSNIQNQQGFGAGQNAADVLATNNAAKSVDDFIANMGDPNLGLEDAVSTEMLTRMGQNQTPGINRPDQKLVTEGLRSDDSGTQQYALDELRKQRAANEAAKNTNQYKQDEVRYKTLQKMMTNMGLSADVAMRMESDIKKGLITLPNAIALLQGLQAKASGKPMNQVIPTGSALQTLRQANDLRIGRNTTDTQPQRQTVPPGLPKAPSLPEQLATRDRALNEMNDDAYVEALARGDLTPEQFRQYQMLTRRR